MNVYFLCQLHEANTETQSLSKWLVIYLRKSCMNTTVLLEQSLTSLTLVLDSSMWWYLVFADCVLCPPVSSLNGPEV
jgi:hypothetical protein